MISGCRVYNEGMRFPEVLCDSPNESSNLVQCLNVLDVKPFTDNLEQNL